MINDYLSDVGVKFEQVATRKINFKKRTNLHKFNCNFLEKLSEKVAMRTVYLTMSTKNKIKKRTDFLVHKAAKTKQYVQASNLKELTVGFYLFYNITREKLEWIENGYNFEKVINMLQTNTRKITKFSRNIPPTLNGDFQISWGSKWRMDLVFSS